MRNVVAIIAVIAAVLCTPLMTQAIPMPSPPTGIEDFQNQPPPPVEAPNHLMYPFQLQTFFSPWSGKPDYGFGFYGIFLEKDSTLGIVLNKSEHSDVFKPEQHEHSTKGVPEPPAAMLLGVGMTLYFFLKRRIRIA